MRLRPISASVRVGCFATSARRPCRSADDAVTGAAVSSIRTNPISWNGGPLAATVARYAQRLRQAQGQEPRQRPPRQTLPIVAEPHHQLLTVRRAIWFVLGREEKRDEDEASLLAQVRAQHPAVAEAIDLAQDFAQLVRQQQPEHLDPWLVRVAQSPLTAL
jgi:hypothetical protein